ncbi:MAG: Lrp/AsnC family transcriptional regulator [Gammaproteobacteria bacterium]|jgi:DNA-binding Lrp family transcriptional regulator|nr:Lrp/AsnC family transcriptional regulator [Gammaproteobacteria bacterium]
MTLTVQQQETLRAAIQDGLPLTARPYATLAQQIQASENDVIGQIQHWLDDGLIKRMGIVVRHHAIGYSANAMVVWNVPDELVDFVAEKMRVFPSVTLCYRRPRRLPDWPYNLFCMIHGRDRHWVLQQIEQLVQHAELQSIPRAVLFSQRQFKQTGGRYARVG